MKFLIDVNASRTLGKRLTEMGHDVIFVSDTNPKMADEQILDWAVEEDRIVVTTDQDFEQTIWQQGKLHCGVLRLENLPRVERLALLEDTLNLHGQDLSEGAIIIALKKGFRIRRPLWE